MQKYLTLLSLVSCSAELEMPCVGAAGLEVCSENKMSSEDLIDMERVVNIIEAEMSLEYPEVVNLEDKFESEGVRVVYVNDLLARDCENIIGGLYECKKYIGGTTLNYGHNIILAGSACSNEYFLPHELLHVIEYFYLGRNNSNNHDEFGLFIIPGDDSEDSMESRILALTSLTCNN